MYIKCLQQGGSNSIVYFSPIFLPLFTPLTPSSTDSTSLKYMYTSYTLLLIYITLSNIL